MWLFINLKYIKFLIAKKLVHSFFYFKKHAKNLSNVNKMHRNIARSMFSRQLFKHIQSISRGSINKLFNTVIDR